VLWHRTPPLEPCAPADPTATTSSTTATRPCRAPAGPPRRRYHRRALPPMSSRLCSSRVATTSDGSHLNAHGFGHPRRYGPNAVQQVTVGVGLS
jgi:hypothetical protein